jgi:hypothetical protein
MLKKYYRPAKTYLHRFLSPVLDIYYSSKVYLQRAACGINV